MNEVRGTFGFTPEHNIGKIAFPAVQVTGIFYRALQTVSIQLCVCMCNTK